MTRLWLIAMVTVALGASAPLAAQAGPGAERLRGQIVERLLQNMKEQAGLTDEQDDRVRQIVRSTMAGRQAQRRQEQVIWQAVEAQLRPGVAADEAELTELLDRLVELQDEGVALNRQQQAELAQFLSPIQRAVVIRSLLRLERQVQQMIQRRMQGGRPGPGPGAVSPG